MAPSESEESHSMLGYRPVDYAKVTKVKDVCEDIENNNNNNNEGSIFNGRNAVTQYSSNLKGVIAQCLVTGTVLLLAVAGGMPIGYSAVLLPQLAEDNGTMHADRELGSWIASVHSLSTPVGSLLSGPLSDIIGRRGCLQLTTIPLCAGWIIMASATNISWLLVGRIVAGFSVGLMAVPSQVLVSEMSDPGLRGFLTGCLLAFYSLGILLIYALGAMFTWDTVALSSIGFPILAFSAMSLVPESPAWLVRRKKLKKARKALLWLRGGDVEQVNTEVAVLEARAKADMARKETGLSWKDQVSSALSTVFEKGVVKPVAIITMFNILVMISGTYIVVFYAVDIVKDVGGNEINNYVAAVITALIRFLFCIMTSVCLLKLGRRTIGISSSLGTAVSSFIIAGYMLVKQEKSSIDTYVLGFCLLLYVGSNTLGLLLLPGLMTAELLPQRARGIVGGCNFFTFNLLIFFNTKCFPMINEAVGITGIFVIFGIAALLEAIFIYVALPETKDRTLQDIEDYFQEDNLLWVTRSRRKPKNELFTVANA